MKIKVLSLEIDNFKGLKHLYCEFSDTTKIYGANGLGKTTIFDAFCWLLFNKDSHGIEKFSVRPLGKDGKPINHLEIKVTAVLKVDDKPIMLSKTQRQKWELDVFMGNENMHEVNGFAYSERKYKEFISEIIDEDVFKLLVNPTHFTSLKWKEQRDILMRFVGSDIDYDILNRLGYSELRDELRVAPDMDSIHKKYSKIATDLKKKLAEMPIRIDEVGVIHRLIMDIVEPIAKRIAEIKQTQRDLSQGMADAERMIFMLEEFTKAKSAKVNKELNKHFNGVEFNLSETLINGSVKENCECTVNGVPFKSLNSGHRIVAGLEIIKALQNLYDAQFPVWIDNAETINVFNLPEMDCQRILFYVSEDETLRMEAE